MHQALAGGNRDSKIRVGETAAHPTHQIRAHQEAVYTQRGAGPAGADREGMVFREGTLPRQRGHDRRLEELRELHEFLRGFRVEHPLASMNNRVLGGQQGSGRLRDGLRVPRLAQAGRGRVVEPLLTELREGHILRDFQQHRSGAAAPQLGEGASHEFRHPFDQVDFGTPFRDRLITARWVKIGMDAAPLPRHTRGQE